MRIYVDIHHGGAKLDEIIRLLRRVLAKETQMAGELSALTEQVQRNTDVEASAVLALQGIRQRLDDAIATGNPAELTRLSANLATSEQALAAAIAATGTP